MSRHVTPSVCKRLQCDEIWAFVGGKNKNLPDEKKDVDLGSVWTWTCIDADTKLIALVGGRDAGMGYEFMTDVAGRMRGRVQLTTCTSSASWMTTQSVV